MCRALRRHHMRRIKDKVLKFNFLIGTTEENLPRAAGILVHSKALCSCTMCGNARRHFGTRTIAELRHIAILKDDINEL